MQSTTTGADHTTGESSRDLFDVLASGPALKVLQHTSEPHTVSTLSNKLDIPTASCQQLLDDLVDLELLRAIEPAEKGKGEQAYQREADDINITYADKNATVDVQRGAAVKSRIADAWDTLADANN